MRIVEQKVYTFEELSECSPFSTILEVLAEISKFMPNFIVNSLKISLLPFCSKKIFCKSSLFELKTSFVMKFLFVTDLIFSIIIFAESKFSLPLNKSKRSLSSKTFFSVQKFKISFLFISFII